MKQDLVRRLVGFVIIVLVQSLVCNNIHLFGYATPLLYTYFVYTFSRNQPRWAILLWCFVLGMTIDTFSNTPGLTASTLTFAGMLQPYVLEIFMSRDHAENFEPTFETMGWIKYPTYLLMQLLPFCLLFFAIESFSFFDWQHWIICSASSFALTFVLILAIDNVKTRK